MAKRSPYLSDRKTKLADFLINPDKGMLDICGAICLQCVVYTL